ncbi:MAG: Mg-protoporphyrin IX monomethyl ester oxidative cyclase, partial [Desulfocapsa sp.]
MQCKLVAINGRYTHSSLALFHVRNELETNCAELVTEIIQLTIRDPYYEVLLRLAADAPDAIFFTAAVWNSEQIVALLKDLSVLVPSCLLVVGGPQATVVGAALEEGICTVVRGAVEAVEPEFYTDLQNRTLRGYYGRSFFHLQNKEGAFRSPYRESDFGSHLLNRNIYYESSRGCPFSCSYCLSSAENGTVHKSVEQVQEELDQIMHHAPKVLRFVDRTFNDLPERALDLWKLLLSYESATLFHFEIAPDRISEE